MTRVGRVPGQVGGRPDGAGVLVEEPDAPRREALGDAGWWRQPADAERPVGLASERLVTGQIDPA
jgi:hypothetical protein